MKERKMGKRILKILSSVVVILCLVSSSWGFLSKEHPTHQYIVDQGIDLKKRVHKDDLDGGKEFDDWERISSGEFRNGAHDEDSTTTGGKYIRSEPPIGDCGDGNFYNHFYNPVTGEGLWGAYNSAIQRIRDILYEIQKITGCPSERKEIPPEYLKKLNWKEGRP
jgi:hypothetical protein